jgi:hypothetical protein
VTRSDVLPGEGVQEVTYAGLPLYQFHLDQAPGQTDGANLFDPLTSPTGTWYLVEPARGHPAIGQLELQAETLGGQTLLSASMDNDFPKLPNGSFSVCTLTNTTGQTCHRDCELMWPPVLTSGRPVAGTGVDQHALGVVVLPNGTRRVTYGASPCTCSSTTPTYRAL